MESGLYSAPTGAGTLEVVWVPAPGSRTALVADLESDSCRLVAADDDLIERATCLMRFSVEEPLPCRPGTASEELAGLLGGYLPHDPSPLEVAALASAFLRSPVKEPFLDGRLPPDRGRNGAVVSELTSLYALDVASSRECASSVRAAVDALLDAACEAPVGRELAASEPIGFAWGDYAVDADVCLVSVRGPSGFEVLEGSAGTEVWGEERWFGDGEDVTSCRDANGAFAGLTEARDGLFAMGVTACAAAAAPNLTSCDLAEASSRAVEEISEREGRSVRGVGI